MDLFYIGSWTVPSKVEPKRYRWYALVGLINMTLPSVNPGDTGEKDHALAGAEV
jgi:hypothetical protein